MKRGLPERWVEALLLPGEAGIVESGLRELSDYFGISPDDARSACLTALADSKREWESAPRGTADQIIDFYRRTRSYIFEHIWWHATDIDGNAANVAILDYGIRSGSGRYLDFGSGVGSNAILFARAGFDVTLADVSSGMLDFSKRRLERRGLRARYIDLNSERLPEGGFDLITAVDVIEHVPDPGGVLRQLALALKPGGRLIFNFRAGFDPERPMHILAGAGPVLGNLRREGFDDISSDDDLLRAAGYTIALRRAEDGLRDLMLGTIDRIRYARPFLGRAAGRVRHPQAIYLELLISAAESTPRWLDVGCGRSLVPSWLKGAEEAEMRFRDRIPLLAGVDPDLEAIRENRVCQLRACFDGLRLPFANGSFDLVTANMVFEHADRPDLLLAEIARVLSPGGRLLILTPNWLDFVTIGARFVPQRFQRAVVSRIEGRAESDVYPTHFRFNSPATIERGLRSAGFTGSSIELLEHPDIYGHLPVISRLESFWHRIAGAHPAFRGVILVDARRGGEL
ncbi:MAG: methyltransferase domain-containing protein [Blastocatellales bacterium]